MKTTYLPSIFLLFLLTFYSCVEDSNFDIPITDIQEPNITGSETTFQAVVAAYQQAVNGGDSFVTFDQDLYITGYVISSDQGANFFEELIIQNKPDGSTSTSDPRLGFKVEINVNSLYTTFQFGRKVYVKLQGLSFGISNGVYVIGKGSNLDQLQPFEYRDFVIRSTELVDIEPKVTSISNLTEADENTFVQIDDVQFSKDMLGLTYAGEQSDQFDGFRTLESCAGSTSILLQTSTFADFKSITVNPNRGSVKGIYSRDFGDDFNVFIINSPSDLDFTDQNRCDPIELDCGIANAEGSNTIFEDNFETQSLNQLISGNGWTNFIEAGSEGWEAYRDTGSNASLGISARAGSFRSGDVSNIAWLISPLVDLDAQTGETLTFQTSNSFADGSQLELLFSSDWDGNPANIVNATWGILPAAYIVKDTDPFSSWFSSGIVDLSCSTGSIYIAFKFSGSGETGFDGTYELDEVKIKSD